MITENRTLRYFAPISGFQMFKAGMHFLGEIWLSHRLQCLPGAQACVFIKQACTQVFANHAGDLASAL
jgi:hypothetical protein